MRGLRPKLTMARDLIIGDVHGCLAELDELLGLLSLAAGYRLFFLGALVDRGPYSVGAIRRVAALLAAFPGSVALCGNHEDKALRLRARETRRAPWASEASEADWRFLDGLPLWHRIPERGLLLVHGGLYPAYFAAHASLGDCPSDWRRAPGKEAERRRRFLRIRTVSPQGQMVSLGQESPASRHWADGYDGGQGFCFYGHSPFLTPPLPRRSPFATGLDTACCFGGRLTAAILGPGVLPGDAALMSVAARAAYAPIRQAEDAV